MDPIKQLLSIFGIAVLLATMYGIFSAFFMSPISNEQLNTGSSNSIVSFSAPLQAVPNAPQDISGVMSYLKYQKGNVVYIENLSLKTQSEVLAYFSRSSSQRDGPYIGALLSPSGNITLYVPSEIVTKDYDYLVLWSSKGQKPLAFVNVTFMHDFD